MSTNVKVALFSIVVAAATFIFVRTRVVRRDSKKDQDEADAPEVNEGGGKIQEKSDEAWEAPDGWPEWSLRQKALHLLDVGLLAAGDKERAARSRLSTKERGSLQRNRNGW